MYKRILYFVLLIILINSITLVFGAPKKKNKKYKKGFLTQYCDLKKGVNIAIVKVNDKSGISELVNNDPNVRSQVSKKGYYTYLDQNTFVSIGDASLAVDKCKVSEVQVGKNIAEKDLECILTNLNKKNKYSGIISNPEDSGWQRGSVQSLEEIERYNRIAKKNGEKLISYKNFQAPQTRTLFEDNVYAQIENALVGAGATVADRANIAASLGEFEFGNSGLMDPDSQKELGKMVGADLIGVADITSYSESTKDGDSVSKIEVILKLINIETGTLFETISLNARNTMKGKGKCHKSRGVCLSKYSSYLQETLNKTFLDFPFETNAKITKRGSVYVYSGSVDGVQNDMIFDLFISEYDEDEDEFFEDLIGQILIVDNEKGRGIKAGTKSQSDALDFSPELLDREEEYLVRIPKDIKSQMKCD